MRQSPACAVLALSALLVAGCAPTTPPPGALAKAAPVVVSPQRGPDGRLMMPAHTEVPLALDQELTSQGRKVGDTFKLSVVRDVMVGNTVVIPRGTPATGAITYRTGKGTLGKSAKIEVEIKSIDLNGHVIAMAGKQRKAGKGNGAATVGMLLLLGPLAAGVTGTSARYKAGTPFTAYTAEPIALPPTVTAGTLPVAGSAN
jgi:hypothetical protein